MQTKGTSLEKLFRSRFNQNPSLESYQLWKIEFSNTTQFPTLILYGSKTNLQNYVFSTIQFRTLGRVYVHVCASVFASCLDGVSVCLCSGMRACMSVWMDGWKD